MCSGLHPLFKIQVITGGVPLRVPTKVRVFAPNIFRPICSFLAGFLRVLADSVHSGRKKIHRKLFLVAAFLAGSCTLHRLCFQPAYGRLRMSSRPSDASIKAFYRRQITAVGSARKDLGRVQPSADNRSFLAFSGRFHKKRGKKRPQEKLKSCRCEIQ